MNFMKEYESKIFNSFDIDLLNGETDNARDYAIVIPDVHGRTFWREAVEGKEEGRIIFLGDYLDPYGHEGITPEMALEEFEAILKFKKEHPDNVTLLLGNHDLGYFERSICQCRHDYRNEAKIVALFTGNLECFDLCREETSASGQTVLISHAGVHPLWVEAHPELFPDGKFEPETLNALFHDKKTRQAVLDALGDVSFYRGGLDEAGSPVWADILEFEDVQTGSFQVVGHTQLKDAPQWIGDVLCIDCRRHFLL